VSDFPADPEAEYRAAEERLLAGYGLTRTERMIDVPGDATRLHVIDIPGDDRIPVLLLHGMAAVTAAAVPLLPAFGGRRVIAPDWPGHGLSGDAELDPADLRTAPVRWLLAVLDDAGADRAHVVAHSMGAQFALSAALAHPDRVASLTILGAPGAAFAGMRIPLGFRLMGVPGLNRLVFAPVSRARYEKNSALTLGPGAVDPWPRELVDCGWYASLRPEFRRTAPVLARAFASRWGVRAEARLTPAELAAIRVPVFALLGAEDVFLTPDAARASLGRIPGARWHVVPGGHAPWLNHPNESRVAIEEFLDERA
jgi:pimeloyl-ACP methyl ester carboxylesterase